MSTSPKSLKKRLVDIGKGMPSNNLTLFTCLFVVVTLAVGGMAYAIFQVVQPQTATTARIPDHQSKKPSSTTSASVASEKAARKNQPVKKDADVITSPQQQTTGQSTAGTPSAQSSPQSQNYSNDNYTYVPTPDPKPQFRVVLKQPPSNNAFGFIIEMVDIVNPNEITEFQEPVIMWPNSDSPRCDNRIYYINSNTSFGFSCTMYSDATYGQWPVIFSVTAKNIYNQQATKSVRGMIVYQQDQVSYRNILSY